MNQLVTIRGREIEATEDTPLTILALAKFFHFGRSRIYGDIERGYKLEFGDLTTPKHYRDWLRNNPRIRSSAAAKAQAASSRLARELSQLR